MQSSEDFGIFLFFSQRFLSPLQKMLRKVGLKLVEFFVLSKLLLIPSRGGSSNLILPHYRTSQLLWRNWLARSAVNRKVGGSRPPRRGKILADDFFCLSIGCTSINVFVTKKCNITDYDCVIVKL